MIDKILKRLTEKKKKLDATRPLTREALESLEEWLKVELTYSSNAIEGNSLTRIETAEIIEKGVSATLKARPIKDQLEAINHARALDFIKALAKTKKGHQYITESDILNIHKLVLAGINDAWAGRYRESEVFIRGVMNVRFPFPQIVPYHMKDFIKWLESQQGIHPTKTAADAHLKLVTIHPFVDGNGRCARLLMNLVLTTNGYPQAVIRQEDRAEYLQSVNTAQAESKTEMFYKIIFEAVERSLDAYLAAASGKPAIPALIRKGEGGKLLKIGELAAATNETKATIRFWTEEGLINITRFTKSGYALYNPKVLETCKKIRKLQKEKRLTIKEIKSSLL